MATITTLDVTGMTCDHCVKAVTNELKAVDGVGRVSVTLDPGATSHVSIFSSAPLAEGALRAAIDEAGYDIAAISQRDDEGEFNQLAETRVGVYGTAAGDRAPSATGAQPVTLTTKEEAAEAAAPAEGGGCGCGGCGCGA